MTVQAADEGLHPAGDDPDWQESVYLAWRDPVRGLGGNHRVGNELNLGTSNLWCGVYTDDGTRFRHNGEQLPLTRLECGVAAGPQRLWRDGGTLHFGLDTDECRVDFEIEDETASLTAANAKSFQGSSGAAGTILADHFNAHCRVRGRVVLGDRAVEVDAPAWRDHSWGVRRWDSFLSSRSFGGAWGPLRFRYGSMVGTNGSFFRRGGITEAGVELAVDSAEMLVAMDDDSLRCPSARVSFHLADGTARTVEIEVSGGMAGVTRQRCGWESVGDVAVDGQPGGWGFLEVNNNPRGGTTLPPFALAEALTNGLVPR